MTEMLIGRMLAVENIHQINRAKYENIFYHIFTEDMWFLFSIDKIPFVTFEADKTFYQQILKK